jgi:hypothetical protein
MKIYVNNLNIEMANEFVDIFQPYLQRKVTYTNVFTDEGWYHIDNKHVYRMEAIDKEIIQHPLYYKQVTLIADHSTCTKQPTVCIYGGVKHASYTVCNYIYKMPTHTHVQLVIQFTQAEGGRRLTPRDIYFEIHENNTNSNTQNKKLHAQKVSKATIDQQLITKRDIDDLFVKSELIEFLSYLF